MPHQIPTAFPQDYRWTRVWRIVLRRCPPLAPIEVLGHDIRIQPSELIVGMHLEAKGVRQVTAERIDHCYPQTTSEALGRDLRLLPRQRTR